MSEPAPSTSKARALKALNTDTRNVQVALNQAASAITHALRLVERDYQRKRTHIINSHEPEPRLVEIDT